MMMMMMMSLALLYATESISQYGCYLLCAHMLESLDQRPLWQASKSLCVKLKTAHRPSTNKKKGWVTPSLKTSEVPRPCYMPFFDTPFWPSATSCNKKNPENDAVLARAYFKYVRAQVACLLTYDRSKTLEFTIDLALWSQQDSKCLPGMSGRLYLYWFGLPVKPHPQTATWHCFSPSFLNPESLISKDTDTKGSALGNFWLAWTRQTPGERHGSQQVTRLGFCRW